MRPFVFLLFFTATISGAILNHRMKLADSFGDFSVLSMVRLF